MDTLYTILAFFAGLLLLWLVCKLLVVPLKIVWKLLLNAVLGVVILFIFNFFGGFINLAIPITPVNCLITGIFGIAGVILLLVWQWVL